MMVQLVKKRPFARLSRLKKGGLELGEAEALVEEMKYILEHGGGSVRRNMPSGTL